MTKFCRQNFSANTPLPNPVHLRLILLIQLLEYSFIVTYFLEWLWVEMEVENMAGSTFAAKRMICDHVHSVGSIDHIDVGNKQLLLYCSLPPTQSDCIGDRLQNGIGQFIQFTMYLWQTG